MWVTGNDCGDEWEEVLLLCALLVWWYKTTGIGVGICLIIHVCIDWDLASWQRPFDLECDCAFKSNISLDLCTLRYNYCVPFRFHIVVDSCGISQQLSRAERVLVRSTRASNLDA